MQRLRANIQRLIDLLAVSNRELNEEERQYLSDWYVKAQYNFTVAILKVAITILPLSVVLVYVMSPQPQRDIQVATHLALSVQIIVGRLFHSRVRAYQGWLIVLAILTTAGGYGMCLRVSFTEHPDFNTIAFLSSLYIAIMVFSIQLFPYPNGSVLLLAIGEVALGGFAWSSRPTLQPIDWMVIAGGIAAFATGIFYARTYRSRAEALGELATRKLLVQAERKRVDSVEMQLAQASEIQDSFGPGEAAVAVGGLAVSFFQIKYGALGGDWTAYRVLPDDQLAIVVADATGKGIQAALVVHAIQTLWANSLSASAFDAVAWLESANQTLMAMGRRKEHTMSLGLVIIGQGQLKYFSAGHLPLFLVCRTAAEQAVVPIMARGNLLGLMENLVLEPQVVDLAAMKVQSILLGTDGVFDRGVRTRKQFVVSLAQDLEASGTEALSQCPAPDDKLVVLVKRAA